MKRDFKQKIVTRIPILDLKRQWSIITDENLTLSIRLLVVFTFIFSGLYFVFPFDVIPDVLLGLGYFDDLALYATLREIAYNAAEDNNSLKGATFETFKSKFVVLTLLLIVIISSALLIYYFFI